MTMPSTTRCKFGDIALVKFPFAEMTSDKLRPTVVTSSEEYISSLPDIMVIAVTSQPHQAHNFGVIAVHHWQQAGLVKSSWIKPSIATISQSCAKKHLGHLHKEDAATLKAVLHKLLF